MKPDLRTIYGAYEPDKPAYLQDGLTDMANAYPGANGYRAVGQFQPFTDPLPGNFMGGAAFVGSNGVGVLLAGTATALYRFNAGVWAAIITGIDATERWAFTQFGDTVVAVNGDVTQRVGLVDATAGPLTGAPIASTIATVRDFVVYGGATGNRALVQWSGFNDETENTPGVDQAGFQPMLDGGDVMGIVGGETGFIIQRNAIRRMTYAPVTQDDVTIPWQFDKIVDETGAMSSGSIANAGQQIFFLSDRGFMMFNGTDAPTPIGAERVDATFFALHGRQVLDTMYCAIDPRRTTVAWLVPASPGRLWVYNWSLDKWSIIEVGAIAVMSGFTVNIALEDLDAMYPDGLESIPYSLDDQRFAGGDPLLLFVDTTNEVGALSGDNMAARFVTPFAEVVQGRNFRLRMLRPISDVLTGAVATIDARQVLGVQTGSLKFAELRPSGDMPVRANGRYISTRIDYAAGQTWTYVIGVEFVGDQAGGR